MGAVIDKEFEKYAAVKLPKIKSSSIQSVLELSNEGGTVPFIARYRKEKTGNLDEVQIRDIIEGHEIWQTLVQRKEFVLAEIEKQGNLTEELKTQINISLDLREIEELYRPYKRKKKTKAKLAKEAGLTSLADWLWKLGQGELNDPTTCEVKAKEFLNPTAGYATYQEVLRGAQHIIIEKVTSNQELRKLVKDEYFNNGKIVTKKTPKFKANSKYDMYGDFTESATNLLKRKASHRYLAMRRGWQEGELKVNIEGNEEELLKTFDTHVCKNPASQAAPYLKEAAKMALTIHMVPSITNELHSVLKDKAEDFAIDVFAENVRRVLMSSPFGAKVVLGVDPGLKTGCKLALVDKNGHFISNTVIHFTDEKAYEKSKKLFEEVYKQIEIQAIAVGNGTGGREAESKIRKIIKELGKETPVVMVNESGASVYSASDIAREEFPKLDLTVRGAISIARRLQDPLAELVKIDPKSIGVGQYQHDLTQTNLKKSLHVVVESCVNQVGVNLNTASSSLLQYVSGIGPAIAKNMVKFREEKGLFEERNQLLKVPQFSSKTYEQAAGFLRIPNGKIPLDRTGIHPERYQAVQEMAKDCGTTVVKFLKKESLDSLTEKKEKWSELVGEFTFEDIVSELKKPGLDPRDPYKAFQFRDDIHEVKDLKKDMICPGIVTNVTNFGAFVDIGVHQDGLVHISELSHEFVDDPRKVVSPGDNVKIKVIDVDYDKNQIALSMLLTEKPKPKARPAAKASHAKGKGPRPDKNAKGKGQRPRGKGKGPHKGGGGSNKPRRPSKPFNNPFAALTEIKK